MNLQAIQELLPHRYPMLLVDRVVELIEGERIVARKAITRNEPWYSRIPPNAPLVDDIYPAAIILESWCQAASILSLAGSAATRPGSVVLFGGLFNVHIGECARPGDVLEHHARLVRCVDDTYTFEGHSQVADRIVLRIESVIVACRRTESGE